MTIFIKTRQRLTPAIAPAAVLCQTGGKPSTWFPLGGLVEQSTDEKQNNKDEDEDEDEDEDKDGDGDEDGDEDQDGDEDGDEDQDGDKRR